MGGDVGRHAEHRARGPVGEIAVGHKPGLAGGVGHVDWEPPNLAWTGPVITTVYDWASLTVLPEAAVAGLTAAVHPVVDDGPGATVEQTAAFLAAYADARDRAWTAEKGTSRGRRVCGCSPTARRVSPSTGSTARPAATSRPCSQIRCTRAAVAAPGTRGTGSRDW